MCRKTGYDPSNWSKIERGLLPPSADNKALLKWAKNLGVKEKDRPGFIDRARIAQGIIPEDVLSEKSVLESLPAFFRTLRNEKPSQKEINNLIKLLKGPINK